MASTNPTNLERQLLDWADKPATARYYREGQIQQIEQMAEGKVRDRWGDLAAKPAKELNENERAALLEHFFKINWHTCIDPYPRYRQLLDLRGRRAGSRQPRRKTLFCAMGERA